MKHNGLRSTIAWAMTSLCPKQVRSDSRMNFKKANAHTYKVESLLKALKQYIKFLGVKKEMGS